VKYAREVFVDVYWLQITCICSCRWLWPINR